MIRIEVVYCPAPGQVDLVALSLADGASLKDAIESSGVLTRHGLALEGLSAGIWGRRQAMDTSLREHDRIEIYRPLQCDPKEARRLRYKQRNERDARSGRAPRPAKPPPTT